MNLYQEHLERTMKAVHMEKVDKIPAPEDFGIKNAGVRREDRNEPSPQKSSSNVKTLDEIIKNY